MFQVTHARKPLASKITQKGSMAVFAPRDTKNISSGQIIDLIDERGAYHLDVEYIAEGFARQG